MGTPEFVKSYRRVGSLSTGTCDWCLKWGQSCGTEPLNLWSRTLTHVRIGSHYTTPSSWERKSCQKKDLSLCLS